MEQGLDDVFERFPTQKTSYDEDCMDLCVPFDQVVTKAKYNEIMQDSDKVD